MKKMALESETTITAWERGKESVVLKRTEVVTTPMGAVFIYGCK
jgi:hypothetical protein